MKLNKKQILTMLIVALLCLALFTPAQAYYSAYIHLILFGCCYLLCKTERKKVNLFLISSFFVMMAFVFLTLIKKDDKVMVHVGFFLHYITWPTLFAFVAKNYKVSQIKKLLYFTLVICIIGDILSLIQLNINPEISRLMAGTQLQNEKVHYYKLGVGGYGYVYAMSFLTYGIVTWIKVSNNAFEKSLLLIILVLNIVYIVSASYTLAVILMIFLFFYALLPRTHKIVKIILIFFACIIAILFANAILMIGIQMADSLNLDWIARRFSQLLEASESNDFSSLKRMTLYKMSIDTFFQNPFLGGKEIGGHSQILDTLGQYGIWGFLLLSFLVECNRLVRRSIRKSDRGVFFFCFLVFALVDTCSAMQIPVSIFFCVPLIDMIVQNKT